MKTTVRSIGVEEEELTRIEIDHMVGTMVQGLCTVLLNERVVQHRDEARVLLYEVFKNRPDLDKMITDWAESLLESGQVQFMYDDGVYSDKGVVG